MLQIAASAHIVYIPKTPQCMSYREKSSHPYFPHLPHFKEKKVLLLSTLKESLYLQFLVTHLLDLVL